MPTLQNMRKVMGESSVAGKGKSKTQSGPKSSSGGPTKWANEGKTRGKMATGRKLPGKFESTYNRYTKLTGL